MKKITLISFLLYSTFSYSTEKIFQSADSLYQLHEFEMAISEYNKIIDGNLESPELYYNLGVCYYQIKEYKKSKLNFQKSLILNPNLNLSLEGIQQINSKKNHKDLPQIFYKKWFDKIINLFTLKMWILASFTLILSLTTVIYIKYILKIEVKKVVITSLFLTNLLIYIISIYKIENDKKIFESPISTSQDPIRQN
ncbi:MAG: hypothetical protein CMD02_04395 [Flavobacteriales bacterium]|nr:hypothetical protein [Flavobacteriales bacterium]